MSRVVNDNALQRIFLKMQARFQKEGLATPGLDARILITHILGMTHEEFVMRPERQLTSCERDSVANVLTRRLAGEPVSRIIGYREFWGRAFALSNHVLDPRADTETLIEAVLADHKINAAQAKHQPALFNLLDLGTGSGIIAITLVCEIEHVKATAVDISFDALGMAKNNAIAHRCDEKILFKQSDWFENIAEKFDYIVANPPYIPRDDIPNLAREVSKFDPELALNGGQDGLDAYREIISRAPKHLKVGGRLFLEIGSTQSKSIKTLFAAHGDDFDLITFRIWESLDYLPRTVACNLLTK